MATEALRVERRTQKGRTLEINLTQVVREIHLDAPDRLTLCLNSLPGQTIRPGEAVQAIFGLSKESTNRLKIVKMPEKTGQAPR